MSAFKGDYMGFSFGKKEDGTPMHSSDLGIVRTSSGSRFNENLLPTMQDKTVQVPGGDGTYYFGSYYTQRQFTVPFAFDSLTEEKVAALRAHFGDKGVHDLVFDECPYKTYRAKVTGTATIKYIPFAEGDTNRLYKGEGSIQFTCYEPFARCSSDKGLQDFRRFEEVKLNIDTYVKGKYYYKEDGIYFLDEEAWATDNNRQYYVDISNTNEWARASKLEELARSDSGKSIKLYNAGDIDTHFRLKLPISSAPVRISLNENFLQLDAISIAENSNDTHIIIDSKQNLVKGLQVENKNGKIREILTGTVYNQYITDGSFFTIPTGESSLELDTIDIDSTNIKYEHLYF